ncbi:MAG TPA: zinc ribbon domain-containing protein [Methanobacteriaceae archaeon]|nr:zinc ribbon domain-containing protein [Methanobacteriaceae archaeon]
MVVCQRCGTENPDGAQYCGGCGRPMKMFPQVKKKEEQPENPESESKIQIFLVIIIVILIVLATQAANLSKI